MKETTYTETISQSDPLFLTKWVTMQGVNGVSGLIKENKRYI